VEAICDRFGSARTGGPTNYRMASNEKDLSIELALLKRTRSGTEAKHVVHKGSSLRPKFNESNQWLHLAAGEMLLNPSSINYFFNYNNNGNDFDSAVGRLIRRPSVLSLILSVGNNEVPFDLADILTRHIYISGEAAANIGMGARIESMLRTFRESEIRQTKAANIERKGGSSLAAAWHLSQLNLDRLNETVI